MIHERSYLKAAGVVAVVCVAVSSIGKRACAQMLVDTGAGWIGSVEPANGNGAAGNYLAGAEVGEGDFRDHFDFSIPTLAGPLLTATLELAERSGDFHGHQGPATTFSVCSLGAFGTYGFSDIGAGTDYGNTNLSNSSDGTLISIPLDGSAISDISGDQGATFSLGGVDSGETSGVTNYDFANTQNVGALLVLTTGTFPPPNGTPEPGGSAAFTFGACTFLVMALRRKR